MEIEFKLRLAHTQLHKTISVKGLWVKTTPNDNLQWKTLKELGFSTRVVNALAAKKTNTLQELLQWNRSRLLHIRNFGTISMNEVDRFLVQHGLELKA